MQVGLRFQGTDVETGNYENSTSSITKMRRYFIRQSCFFEANIYSKLSFIHVWFVSRFTV